MSQSWRVTLPCTREDAERLKDDIGPLGLLDNPPVLMTSEPDPAKPDDWQLDAYFDARPGKAIIGQLLALLTDPVAKPVIEALPDEDWVTMSQAGLEPISEGRFYVYTSSHIGSAPAGSIPFLIDAGRAFGTGQHATTAGCLGMIDRLVRSGAHFRNILDLGTGTGVLGFAAARAFRGRTIASDIDPVSIEVARENAIINRVSLGTGHGEVELVVADGMAHRQLRRRAPYDLIIANILAKPLIEMSADIAAGLKPGGSLILAGLLDQQASAVSNAYARHGCQLVDRIDRDEWPTLRLRRSISAHKVSR